MTREDAITDFTGEYAFLVSHRPTPSFAPALRLAFLPHEKYRQYKSFRDASPY